MQQEAHRHAYSASQLSPIVLVIDDEESIIELIKLGLKYEGFQVEASSSAEEGLEAAQRTHPTLIILDRMLPEMDGLEVCRRLRANSATRDIPILVLTAKNEVHERVKGLNTGADDYLTKPFSFDELVARIRAILRRQSIIITAEDPQVLQVGDLQLNMATHEVRRAGQLIDLTTTEYNLLHFFMRHAGKVLDRRTILNQVWGHNFLGETNIIDVYVRYLREKIEDSPGTPRFIQTIRGIGYILKG
jgi:two-component system, OmpR family, response regulator MprA